MSRIQQMIAEAQVIATQRTVSRAVQASITTGRTIERLQATGFCAVPGGAAAGDASVGPFDENGLPTDESPYWRLGVDPIGSKPLGG